MNELLRNTYILEHVSPSNDMIPPKIKRFSYGWNTVCKCS